MQFPGERRVEPGYRRVHPQAPDALDRSAAGSTPSRKPAQLPGRRRVFRFGLAAGTSRRRSREAPPTRTMGYATSVSDSIAGLWFTIVSVFDHVTARVTPPSYIDIVHTSLDALKAGVRRQVSGEA